jgi:hypothetical protein
MGCCQSQLKAKGVDDHRRIIDHFMPPGKPQEPRFTYRLEKVGAVSVLRQFCPPIEPVPGAFLKGMGGRGKGCEHQAQKPILYERETRRAAPLSHRHAVMHVRAPSCSNLQL